MSEHLEALRTVDPKDVNDLAVGWMGMSATWAFDNIFQIIGSVVAIMSLVFIIRRHNITLAQEKRKSEIDRLDKERLELVVSKLKSGDDV